MLTSAQFGRQFGRHFGQEKTFHGERRTGTSALGFLSQGSWGSGDDLAWSRTHTQRAGPTRYSLRRETSPAAKSEEKRMFSQARRAKE